MHNLNNCDSDQDKEANECEWMNMGNMSGGTKANNTNTFPY